MKPLRETCCRGIPLFVFLILCAFLGQLVHAQNQKITISISSRSNVSIPYYVAASKGFFREEGMDVEIIQANPRLGVMALMNGDVAFTGTFVSTVRGILSGFPLKIILVVFKKGVYYLIAHPSIKDIQDLKGKKLGVSSIRGSDHLVAEELLKSKGFNPAMLQPVVQWVKQTPEIAARSYDVELKSILRDGIMSDAEMENFLDRLADKKRPLDEVRDFSFVRQAWKELEQSR